MLPIEVQIERAQRLVRMLEQDVPLLAIRVAELTPEYQQSAKSHAAMVTVFVVVTGDGGATARIQFGGLIYDLRKVWSERLTRQFDASSAVLRAPPGCGPGNAITSSIRSAASMSVSRVR